MKIISVRFHNINSLKNTSVIPFNISPLSDSSIFAITGVTGSGKSSILDAISLALYGQAPRCGDKIDGIITYNTPESWSEVEFEVKGEMYRSRWSVRKAHNKATGTLQAPKMELTDLKTNEIIEERRAFVPEKVAEITGLDYKQFLKSMLLAQGDFAAFLKANKNERGDLLEKITGTEIYSLISMKVFEKEKLVSTEWEQKKLAVSSIQLLTQDEEQNFSNELTEINKKQEEINLQINSNSLQINWLQDLSKLNNKINIVNNQIKQLEIEKEKRVNELETLALHEKAIRFKPDLIEIENYENQINNFNSKKTISENNSKTLNKQINQKETELLAVNQQIEQFNKEREILEPLIQEIILLDSDIKRQSVELQSINKQFAEKAKELENQNKNKIEKQEQLINLQNSEKKGKQYLIDNEVYEQLSNKLGKLEELFKNYDNYKSELKNKQIKISEIEKLIPEINSKINKNTENKDKFNSQQNELSKLSQGYVQQLADIQHKNDLQYYENNYTKLIKEIPLINELCDISNEFLDNSERLKIAESSLIEGNLQLQTINNQLNELNSKLETEKKIWQLLQENLRKAEIIKSLDEHRKALKPDEPCPLCGATSHPLANYSVVNEVSKSLKDCKDKEKEVELLTKKINELNQQLVKYQTETKQTEQNKLSAIFKTNQLVNKFNTISTDINISLTINQFDEICDAVKERENSVSELEKLIKQIKLFQSKIIENDKKNSEIAIKLNDIEKQIIQYQNDSQAKQNEISRLLNEISTLNQNISSLETTINQEFADNRLSIPVLNDWQKWLNETQKKCKDYKTAQQKILTIQNNILQLAGEIATNQALIEHNEIENNNLKNQINEVQNILNNNLQNRKSKFGDKNTETEKTRISNQLKTLQSNLQTTQNQLHELKQKMASETTLLEESTKMLVEFNEKLIIANSNLLTKAADFGFLSKNEIKSKIIDENKYNNISKLKENLNRQSIEFQAQIKSLNEEYRLEKNKNLSENNLEELNKLQHDNSQIIKDLNEKSGKMKQQIQENESKKKTAGNLMQELELWQKEYNKWHQLNELIGSAKGDKFRVFAQGLTLTYLINKANERLTKLNARYEIIRRSDGDLDLAIIDRYQANNMRTLNTLSGGETFLVSLSLALGLSDLAGKNTRIDSLFIDEGFGTLDSETLDTAIAALENLQKQGKNIGIISHVEALKERITTQIRVKKINATESKIEILG